MVDREIVATRLSYADIDHEIIYIVLQNDLADLEAFAVAMARISEKET